MLALVSSALNVVVVPAVAVPVVGTASRLAAARKERRHLGENRLHGFGMGDMV
jgi:hypothetical protein